jgi:hypothetical protein
MYMFHYASQIIRQTRDKSSYFSHYFGRDASTLHVDPAISRRWPSLAGRPSAKSSKQAGSWASPCRLGYAFDRSEGIAMSHQNIIVETAGRVGVIHATRVKHDHAAASSSRPSISLALSSLSLKILSPRSFRIVTRTTVFCCPSAGQQSRASVHTSNVGAVMPTRRT